MDPAYPSPGSDFGDYRLVDILGSGGMSVVFSAVHRRLGRTVALKVLPPHLARSELYRARFETEADLLTRLESPHVVSVHDHGEIDGLLYLAMQRIDGEDLGRILADRGPLPPAEALLLAIQMADALADAHRGGILHRDVKPSNVLVGSSGDEPFGYLCDFGIAKLEDVDSGLTHTGLVAGTWAYLAPERARQQPASRASDLYSLGCVLWAMLTGAAPFRGSDADLLLAHQQQPVPQLSESGPLAEIVNRVFDRTLAKDPADRFSTAGDLKAELRAAAAIAASTPLEQLRPAVDWAGPAGAGPSTDPRTGGDASAAESVSDPRDVPTSSCAGWWASVAASDAADEADAAAGSGGSGVGPATPAGRSPDDRTPTDPSPGPSPSTPPPPRRRRRTFAAVLAVLAVLVVVGIGAAVWQGGLGSDDKADAGPDPGPASSPGSASSRPSTSGDDATPKGDPLDVGVERIDLGCSGQFVVVLTGRADGDPAQTVRHTIDRFPGAPDPHYLSTADSCANLSSIRTTQYLPDLPYLGPFPTAADACRSRIAHTDITTYVVRLDPDVGQGYLCACAYAAADLPDLDQTRDAEGAEGPRRFWTRGLQTMLSSVGHDPTPLAPGSFDQATADAVSSYQAELGLSATGGMDADTWAALQERLCDE